MEQNTNQTYTIEEKTGKIIKVEEANEKQRLQKQSLKVKIAALCIALGVTGIGGYTALHANNTNEVPTNSIQTDMDNSIDAIKESETEDMISHKTSVYLEEDLINGEWIGVNLLSRNTGDVPLDTNDKRYILCGATEENINNLYVYQKETRSVSADSNGTYQIESDWTPVMEFNVTANPLEIPHDTLDSRYVIVACGNNVASMIGELNSQIQAENTVTAGRTR